MKSGKINIENYDKSEFCIEKCEGGYRLAKYIGGGEEAIVPEGVTQVDDFAFFGCNNVCSIRLPDSLESWGGYAVYNCPRLENFSVGEGNEHFYSHGGVLFSHGESFSRGGGGLLCYPAGRAGAEYIVPKGVESIARAAFYSNAAVERVVLPDSLRAVGSGAFTYCRALKDIELPAGVREVGDQAFWECAALERVKMPRILDYLGAGVFYGCNSLKNLELEKGSAFAFEGGALLSADRKRVYLRLPAADGEVYVIPDGAEEICDRAFYYCGKIRSIVVPKSMKRVGSGAFLGCGRLESVRYAGTMEKWQNIEFGDARHGEKPPFEVICSGD